MAEIFFTDEDGLERFTLRNQPMVDDPFFPDPRRQRVNLDSLDNEVDQEVFPEQTNPSGGRRK